MALDARRTDPEWRTGLNTLSLFGKAMKDNAAIGRLLRGLPCSSTRHGDTRMALSAANHLITVLTQLAEIEHGELIVEPKPEPNGTVEDDQLSPAFVEAVRDVVNKKPRKDIKPEFGRPPMDQLILGLLDQPRTSPDLLTAIKKLYPWTDSADVYPVLQHMKAEETLETFRDDTDGGQTKYRICEKWADKIGA